LLKSIFSTLKNIMISRGNIFLIGLMGAGKTTLGKALATALKKKFIDADNALEETTQQKISDIFAGYGEGYFRDIETAVLSEICGLSNIVLATGGGAVLRPENRRILRENGTVIYLYASPETLTRRLENAIAHRPVLAGASDLLARQRSLYKIRAPFYQTAAHIIHSENDGETPEESLERLLKVLSEQ
jgi:shikimate kinase